MSSSVMLVDATSITRLVTAVMTATILTACGSDGRSAVRWTELDVSDDRRTITVTTWYGPFCRRLPDGVDVDVRDDEIVVSAWLRDSREGSERDCNADCATVTQTATIAVPLPDDRPFRPPANHALGCGD